jgi:hypothetical protein
MITPETKKVIHMKYRLMTVEKTHPPEGMSGDNWYRYMIGRGSAKIVGRKPGTLETVTRYAEACTRNLNSRADSFYSPFAPRKRK